MYHKFIVLIFVFFLFSTQTFAGKVNGKWDAELVRVIDGDTFEAKVKIWNNNFVFVKVRILGIDTPEKNGDCEEEKVLALKAKNYLKELLSKSKNLVLFNVKDGKYGGRTLANVRVNNKDITSILLRKPFVRPYKGKKRKSWCDFT